MTSEAPGGSGAKPSDLSEAVRERLKETAKFNKIHQVKPGEKPPQPSPRPTGEAAQGIGVEHVRTRGAADQPTVFGALIAGGGVRPCIFQNLGIVPFTATVMQGEGFSVEHLALIGVISAARVERGQESAVRQQIIAETLAPNFPLQQCLSKPLAQEELGRVLNNVARFREAAWFSDIVLRLEAKDNLVANVYDRSAGVWKEGATIAEQLGLLMLIIRHPDCRERERCLYGMFILLIAFATRGNLSQPKADRIMSELRGLMPVITQMFRREDIALTYQNFGQYINDENANVVMQRWLAQVPQGAVRLRVLLAQAAGSGLTALDLFARAIHEHPGFPWAVIARMYPEAWNNADEAFRAVGGRVYYGFRQDLGPVRATRFKPLTWVAHKLLCAVGDQALRNYRGVSPIPADEAVITEMISAYLETLAAGRANVKDQVTDEEYQSVLLMLGLARNHPSVVTDLANMAGHEKPTVPGYKPPGSPRSPRSGSRRDRGPGPSGGGAGHDYGAGYDDTYKEDWTFDPSEEQPDTDYPSEPGDDKDPVDDVFPSQTCGLGGVTSFGPARKGFRTSSQTSTGPVSRGIFGFSAAAQSALSPGRASPNTLAADLSAPGRPSGPIIDAAKKLEQLGRRGSIGVSAPPPSGVFFGSMGLHSTVTSEPHSVLPSTPPPALPCVVSPAPKSSSDQPGQGP